MLADAPPRFPEDSPSDIQIPLPAGASLRSVRSAFAWRIASTVVPAASASARSRASAFSVRIRVAVAMTSWS